MDGCCRCGYIRGWTRSGMTHDSPQCFVGWTNELIASCPTYRSNDGDSMTTSADVTQPPRSSQTSDTTSARAGVGYSDRSDSREAGAEAARLAMAQAGTESCDLVLVFPTSKHDAVALCEGVRSVVGLRPRIAGGSSVGTITND